MSKCIRCAAELPAQARFCYVCGAEQSVTAEPALSTGATNPLSQQPQEENTPSVLPIIPPPPPSEENDEEPPARTEILVLEVATDLPGAETALSPYPSGDVHGPHLQPQQPYGPHLQPQQPYGSHLQPQQPYGSHLSPQPYGSHLQPQQPYGPHLQPKQPYGPHLQPQNSIAHPMGRVTRVGTTVTKTGTAMVGKWVIISVVAVVVLGASGIGVALALHLFTPQPVLNVVSMYNAKGEPIGANGTTLHVSGQKFAANSAITFLFDNTPLNVNQHTQSDANGNVTTNLTVTSAWRLGQHTLTARDANNNTTQIGTKIDIVQPGESHTPGPNGAPPDDASFTILLNVQATLDTYGTPYTYTYKLIITGHPDPAGGTVCSDGDDGTSVSDQFADYITKNATDNRTRSFSCSGTYKGGIISYEETLKTETVTSSDGEHCTLNHPEAHLKITGSYTAQHNFSGQSGYISIPEFRVHLHSSRLDIPGIW